jgi:hypothetical protein
VKEPRGVQESEGVAGSSCGRIKRRQRWLLILGIGLPLLFIGLILGFFLILTRPSHDLVQSSLSPDGRWTVEVFYVNPGSIASAWMVVEAKSTAGGKEEKLGELLQDDLTNAIWANREELTIQWETSTSLLVGGYPMEMGSGGNGEIVRDETQFQSALKEASFPVSWLGEQYQGATLSGVRTWDGDTVTMVYATPDFSRKIYVREDNLLAHPGRATLYSASPRFAYVRDVPLQNATGKIYAANGFVLVFRCGKTLYYVADSGAYSGLQYYSDMEKTEQVLRTTSGSLRAPP